jgi:phosphatidylserine decarboxylase
VKGPEFLDRPTEILVEDAYRLGAIPLTLGALCGALGSEALAGFFLAAAAFVAFFFRNPDRFIPGDEKTVVSPADGKVLDVSEVERPDGSQAIRIGIFLSVFNVHVNRVPLSGRVVSIERSGNAYLAAFNPDAETRNVRCDMTLEVESGAHVQVSQITGLIARRIVCHPKVGDVLRRGDRYGLIRFGSRTDVLLPLSAEVRVVRGEKVRGGSTVLALLGEDA